MKEEKGSSLETVNSSVGIKAARERAETGHSATAETNKPLILRQTDK